MKWLNAQLQNETVPPIGTQRFQQPGARRCLATNFDCHCHGLFLGFRAANCVTLIRGVTYPKDHQLRGMN